MKNSFALACLLLAGCPTTTTTTDAGQQPDAVTSGDSAVPTLDAPPNDAFVASDAAADAPAVACMPEGVWSPTGWVADAANPASCRVPSLSPARFNAAGFPVEMDGTPLACPMLCDASTCRVTPAAGPTCSGEFFIAFACSGAASGASRYAIHGDTADFEFEMMTADGTCIFRSPGNRVVR